MKSTKDAKQLSTVKLCGLFPCAIFQLTKTHGQIMCCLSDRENMKNDNLVCVIVCMFVQGCDVCYTDSQRVFTSRHTNKNGKRLLQKFTWLYVLCCGFQLQRTIVVVITSFIKDSQSLKVKQPGLCFLCFLDLTYEFIQRGGLRDPIIFEKPDGLGLKWAFSVFSLPPLFSSFILHLLPKLFIRYYHLLVLLHYKKSTQMS